MSIDACAALVEDGDPDRFAATMAAPPSVRQRLWPIYAYNLEVARAPWASSEPMIAEMRLQWWIDTVDAMGQGTQRPGHDVTTALAPLVSATDDLAALLVHMAEARRWEVWCDPFPDAAALTAHLADTAGTLMWAAAKVLNAPTSAEHTVRTFGTAAGLASWLRAVPALKAHGRHPLPDPSPEAIRMLAQTALDEIASVEAAQPAIPAHVVPALWPGWQARRVLAMAAEDPARVEKGTLATSEVVRRGGLLWKALRGTW